jgi:hypothetical protein
MNANKTQQNIVDFFNYIPSTSHSDRFLHKQASMEPYYLFYNSNRGSLSIQGNLDPKDNRVIFPYTNCAYCTDESPGIYVQTNYILGPQSMVPTQFSKKCNLTKYNFPIEYISFLFNSFSSAFVYCTLTKGTPILCSFLHCLQCVLFLSFV